MSKILLIGAGGHAKSCIDVIEKVEGYEIGGLVDNNLPRGSDLLGYPILGSDKDLKNLRKKFELALIAIGQLKSSDSRTNLFNIVKNFDYKTPSIISPYSYVSEHSDISEGTILMHGVIVNAGVSIGTNCIVNSKCLIEHDSKIGDDCHLSTGSILNGGVSVGEGSFIGSGSVVKQNIDIGKKCIIGAGLFVTKNLEEGSFLR